MCVCIICVCRLVCVCVCSALKIYEVPVYLELLLSFNDMSLIACRLVTKDQVQMLYISLNLKLSIPYIFQRISKIIRLKTTSVE